MEVAVIDWKDSKFVKDDIYEHINAPQWIDFSALNDDVNDQAWFCRPDCNHPKTVEDFMKKTPGDSKRSSSSVSEMLPSSDRNLRVFRDGALKKRGPPPGKLPKKDLRGDDIYVGDCENHNPNNLGTTTPPNHYKAKLMIKSSAEKQQQQALTSFLPNEGEGEAPPPRPPPRLTSTLSARNLFAGKDILNQITELCNELKRLATRRQKEETSGDGEVETITGKEESQVGGAKKYDRFSADNSGVLREIRENKRKPLLEKKCGEEEEPSAYKSSSATKEKLRRKKRNDEAENSPISVNLKSMEERLLQIRTNPPSPQCFSANPPKKVRGILQELEPSSKEEEAKKGITPSRAARNATTSAVAAGEKEAGALDVFWFLKPCTLASN